MTSKEMIARIDATVEAYEASKPNSSPFFVVTEGELEFNRLFDAGVIGWEDDMLVLIVEPDSEEAAFFGVGNFTKD